MVLIPGEHLKIYLRENFEYRLFWCISFSIKTKSIEFIQSKALDASVKMTATTCSVYLILKFRIQTCPSEIMNVPVLILQSARTTLEILRLLSNTAFLKTLFNLSLPIFTAYIFPNLRWKQMHTSSNFHSTIFIWHHSSLCIPLSGNSICIFLTSSTWLRIFSIKIWKICLCASCDYLLVHTV